MQGQRIAFPPCKTKKKHLLCPALDARITATCWMLTIVKTAVVWTRCLPSLQTESWSSSSARTQTPTPLHVYRRSVLHLEPHKWLIAQRLQSLWAGGPRRSKGTVKFVVPVCLFFFQSRVKPHLNYVVLWALFQNRGELRKDVFKIAQDQTSQIKSEVWKHLGQELRKVKRW